MHSYWDDFFALRGFKDAAFLAGELGRRGRRGARWPRSRDEFAADLAASVAAAHAACTASTTCPAAPISATSTPPRPPSPSRRPAPAAILPRGALERTFERYWEFFTARRDGAPWEAFTPYEMRNIGAFVRLGWRERAQELLDFFLAHQQPAGWRQWAEVGLARRPRARASSATCPHTWVGSDYVRSVLDMFAYEREADSTLVVGAGVPIEWLVSDPRISVLNLSTHYGPLSFTMRRAGDGVEVAIEAGTRIPPGGIAVSTPLAAIRSATVNGARVEPGPTGEILVRKLPATVLATPEP